MSKYMTWQLIAPPATRFYQMADGNFSLYFEKEKVDDMVVWAEKNLEAFMRLKVFIEQQAKAEEEQEVVKATKAQELSARAANISPNGQKGHTPNLRTKEALQKVEAASKPLPKGVKPPKPTVAGNPVTTQEEVEAAVPELPKPKKLPDLSLVNEPGMKIALQQQRALDAQNGINREVKNEATEDIEETENIEDNEEQELENAEPIESLIASPQAIPQVSDTEPSPAEEDAPPTERPQVAAASVDDSPY